MEEKMSKTVLVTGGTGFIGGSTIVELLKRGYSVRTTDIRDVGICTFSP
jgi:dihydroflavonol-4-reductase